MTTTTIIGPVTVGVTAAQVSNITKHTFSSTSGAFNLQAGLTAGTAKSLSKLAIHYAPIMDNVTADSTAVDAASRSSFQFDVPATEPMVLRLITTDIEGCRGRYLLVWTEEPLLGASASLTVKVTEY